MTDRTNADVRRGMRAGHVVAAVALGVVIPAISWLDGSGSLAWTMFSKSETYRLAVLVFDDEGRRRVINPTELAPFASVDLAAFLSGAESWRHAPVGASLERSVPGLARLACQLSPRPARTRVSLERRVNLDAPVQVSEGAWACSP